MATKIMTARPSKNQTPRLLTALNGARVLAAESQRMVTQALADVDPRHGAHERASRVYEAAKALRDELGALGEVVMLAAPGRA